MYVINMQLLKTNAMQGTSVIFQMISVTLSSKCVSYFIQTEPNK